MTPGARLIEVEVTGRGESLEVGGRAVHQFEPRRGRHELRMAVAAHRRAGQEVRPANAEREAIRSFEPAPVHRGERAGNGNGVLDVRGERRGGRESDRHRITPLEPAPNSGGDSED